MLTFVSVSRVKVAYKDPEERMVPRAPKAKQGPVENLVP